MSALRGPAHARQAGEGRGGLWAEMDRGDPENTTQRGLALLSGSPSLATAESDSAELLGERSSGRTKQENIPQNASKSGLWEVSSMCSRSPQHHRSRWLPPCCLPALLPGVLQFGLAPAW